MLNMLISIHEVYILNLIIKVRHLWEIKEMKVNDSLKLVTTMIIVDFALDCQKN